MKASKVLLLIFMWNLFENFFSFMKISKKSEILFSTFFFLRKI